MLKWFQFFYENHTNEMKLKFLFKHYESSNSKKNRKRRVESGYTELPSPEDKSFWKRPFLLQIRFAISSEYPTSITHCSRFY